ncbi:MAG: helix-turn-helix transcriptional regulator [Myxococcales bacterium]
MTKEAAVVLDLLETSYRIDLDGSAYVAALAEGAAPLLDRGLGVMSYTYDARDPAHPIIDHFATSSRFDPSWLAPFYAAIEAAAVDIGSPEHPTGFAAWGHLTCGQASRIPAMKPILPLFAHIGGSVDAFAVNGRDASGRGLWIGAPLPTTRREPPENFELLTRLSAHLTSAVRLRRNTGNSRPKPSAVMKPDGTLLHAEPDPAIVDARQTLRLATLAFDRARTKKMRGDVELATRRWRPLVASRWSLIDDFDSDGRRFVVAVENEPPTRPPRTTLSEREHQVLTQAHMGHSMKLIAYELGLSAATVRVLFHRAARKLGASTRQEAITRFDALGKAPPESDEGEE